jgi:hypothetical protein
MRARSVSVVLVLASVLIFRSDTFVEGRLDLPSIVSSPLSSTDPSFDAPRSEVFNLPIIVSPPISVDDPSDRERHPDAAPEEKVVPTVVSLPMPFTVYYAYNEYHTYERPIDLIATSLVGLPIGSCRDEVKRAADVYGLSFPVMMAFAQIESSCQPRQKTGSYIGLFQLSRYEFNRYGRTGGDVYDQRDNAMAAAHKFVVEAIDFERAVGRYPTPFDRYCIHQQGSGGCIEHQARPDRIAWQSMCATEEGKTKGDKWCRSAIWRNVPRNLKASIKGGVEALTSSAFLEIWQSRVLHFTKIMTGVGEAHAETPIIPAPPRVPAKPSRKKQLAGR